MHLTDSTHISTSQSFGYQGENKDLKRLPPETPLIL